MFWRRIAAAALAAALSVPMSAVASGSWTWPVDSPRVSVPYGATYTAPDGRRCTHGGIDIETPAGARVGACAGGQVTFSGEVPAANGRRTSAVTVATDDGLRVTYLPLERASVHSGDRVEAGDTIGQLAVAGDGSSAEPHLHVGVKRESRQLDPMAFLGSAPVPSPAPAPRPLVPKGVPDGPGPGLPTRPPAAGAHASAAARAASMPVVRSGSKMAAAGPEPASGILAVRSSFASALRAAHGSSSAGALRSARMPAVARAAQVVAAAVRARDGIAWVVVRLMLIAAGTLCLRPVLHAMRKAAPVPRQVAVRRTRV